VLRTNLGRAERLRSEIIQAHTHGLPLAGASWQDVPMRRVGNVWELEVTLPEPGFFKAKPYFVDSRGWQVWPDGPDAGISVHPDAYRSGNTIYCAFTRMFGKSRELAATVQRGDAAFITKLDGEGYTVIPPSGKLRDLTHFLPHIVGTLGCRILQLLPVNPTPTTYARFGRYGSPYASLDLTAIDPALVVFDQRTTGIEQFRELTYGAHLAGAKVFLDIVINHTGWGSVLQENNPEWFLRGPEGKFISPGAWGVTWEDLVELKHVNVGLWDELAEVFLTWCRRGVDGFRCDAGYMVPMPAWQYIVARVQGEYPETLFLLEGLGGAWEATEALLTDGGMQWAYSELFQNYSAAQVSCYLDHSLKQSERVGNLVHFSETHDNARLAAKGRSWSLLRNRLCALTSIGGGYGFTCGVEWLAAEKIRVHDSTGMRWGDSDNIIPELAQLNRLLCNHPCFFDGANVKRISSPGSPVYAIQRVSAEGLDSVLVVANPELSAHSELVVAADVLPVMAGRQNDPTSGYECVDLLGQEPPKWEVSKGGQARLKIPPGAVYCLSAAPEPKGLAGESYRRAKAQATWGEVAMGAALPVGTLPDYGWRNVAALVNQDPAGILAAASLLHSRLSGQPSAVPQVPEHWEQLLALIRQSTYRPVIEWALSDARRVTAVPPEHWLLVRDAAPFRASLDFRSQSPPVHRQAIPVENGFVAAFPPRTEPAGALLRLERYADGDKHFEAVIRWLPSEPVCASRGPFTTASGLQPHHHVLLTNGRGGMARLCVDLGRITSKYDCVLGANLHPTLPVDRHVFVKRIRVWVDADGFISPLDFHSLGSFNPGPPAVWEFVANAGDGRTVQIQVTARMVPGQNTVIFNFSRPGASDAIGKQLPPAADVRLTVRLDLEDRNFHAETHRNGGAEHHFNSHTTVAERGFRFAPAQDRELNVLADAGAYHPQPEWSENIPHPVEQTRGQVGSGDGYSPGWFELPMPKGAQVALTITAEPAPVAPVDPPTTPKGELPVKKAAGSAFEELLASAMRAFVVRRGVGVTVIAGYPWFLDWGRDTFICARGMIAAGLHEEVKQLLVTFGQFEKDGTLPNTIFGEDASNRDTSDAPLWFCLAVEELAQAESRMQADGHYRSIYETEVEVGGRTILQVMESIARHYSAGTPNRIRMDPDSGLIWSPRHFTWMDTNYPTGTPREGFPVEIQALWIRLLRQLSRKAQDRKAREKWEALASRATGSLERLFWLEDRGWYADALRSVEHEPAAKAVVEDALRSNCLFVVSLGLAEPAKARRCVAAVQRFLVVPGALRSIAPLPVSTPLPVYGNDGRLLNNPAEPYWGKYEGDEDTRRKPAYHNGTAWTWTFPTFCEALAISQNCSPESIRTARAYLSNIAQLMAEGCLGQIPEVLDGDAPHTPRGCDAQAWSATEALRVWRWLNSPAGATT
jgi:predicted glycogen debranching enzyme